MVPALVAIAAAAVFDGSYWTAGACAAVALVSAVLR